MKTPADRLTRFIGSEARARILAHFVAHPTSSLGMRELERHTGLRSRSVQLELRRLAAMDLLARKDVEGRAIYLRTDNPAWSGISQIISTYGTLHLLRDTLHDVPGAKAAFVFGSRAKGDARPDSDYDVVLYGDSIEKRSFGAALSNLYLLVSDRLDIKAYDRDTFVKDARPGASFLHVALAGPKVWLFGSEADLPPGTIAA